MQGSTLQERMVSNQKQTIEASMAAEGGAVMAMRWLRAHPGTWGDAEAWKTDGILPSQAAMTPQAGGQKVVSWIESIRFDGDTATVVSHGGVVRSESVMEQSTITAVMQRIGNESSEPVDPKEIVDIEPSPHGHPLARNQAVKDLFGADDLVAESQNSNAISSASRSSEKHIEYKTKIIFWRQTVAHKFSIDRRQQNVNR